MRKTDYQKQLEELGAQKKALDEKKAVLAAKEKQIKAKIRTQESERKRAWENHVKAVLGGALYGILKNHNLPDDRKMLQLYGNAVRDTFRDNAARLLPVIDARYQQYLMEAASTESTSD